MPAKCTVGYMSFCIGALDYSACSFWEQPSIYIRNFIAPISSKNNVFQIVQKKRKLQKPSFSYNVHFYDNWMGVKFFG
mgnify:CR=1 FL=1